MRSILNKNYQEKLSHLTDDQITELMSKYYEGENNQDLIEEYSIDISKQLLVKAFPFDVHDYMLCPNCNLPMVSYKKSKTSPSTIQEKYCAGCNHRSMELCHCFFCTEKREIEEKFNKKEEKRKFVSNFCKGEPFPYHDLSFEKSIFLYSMVENKLNINNIVEFQSNNFLPDKYITEKEINNLIKGKLIRLDEPTYLKVEEKIDNILRDCNIPLELKEYYIITYAHLRTNITRNGIDRISDEDLCYLLKCDIQLSFDGYPKKEILEFLIKIVTYEVLSFIYHDNFHTRLNTYQVKNLNVAVKTLLEKNYTVSQVKGIVNMKYKSLFKRRNPDNTPRGINTLIKKIREYAGEMQSFNRYSNQEQCLVSQTFCNLVLKTNDDYFNSNIFYFLEKSYKSTS